jgi:hypothetical protein
MFYLPIIAQDDFEAVRGIMRPHMPYTYDEWLKLSADWVGEYGADGFMRRNVDIDEYAAFVSGSGRAPDLQSLLGFVQPVHDRDTD